MRTFLHVGCGPAHKEHTTLGFNAADWQELRLDIDPAVQPDVLGTMTSMQGVQSLSMDAIFSSHNIEHLYAHEVPVALKEFKRVLKSDGFAVITCPDLQSVCALVANNKLLEPAYTSAVGPIAPLDILYGHRAAMARGNLYMAHRSGFTARVLTDCLSQAGFSSVRCYQRPQAFDLWAVATMDPRSPEALHALAQTYCQPVTGPNWCGPFS